ncbi:dihydroorotase [Basilea psittacipulmonis]|uniref:Dihydroorotase n=1 Tax=Basilea psittacipulmonis DSM 24701 TaxID=1072685 RepID=A0A077DCQ0_9BURK|nr:dihydroorotase [Basilea psittacipulmonis]AIL32379.1 dihydroorotase [Basilea psittacipulmonis DSM 24701]
MSVETLTIRQPDDWHLHLRDEEALRAVLPDTVRQFRRAIIMPNLKPPVTTTEQAVSYHQRIASVLADTCPNQPFEALMTLYLTDNTEPYEIIKAVDSGLIYALKLYPAGATTNSDAGVTNLKLCYPTLEKMQELGLPLLIHGEVTDPNVDIFDRETVFIDRVLIPLRKDFPELKIVFEHITTKQAVDYVMATDEYVAATITAHHLLYDRNAIFKGGIRPHYYCLPVLKRSVHREALLQAATSDSPKFFLGTDSAPHASVLKENATGCAGCYTGLHAMELYATAFEQAGKLDKLEAFASVNGPKFYGLALNEGTLTLKKTPFHIPESLEYVHGSQLIPLAAGETLAWSVQYENE